MSKQYIFTCLGGWVWKGGGRGSSRLCLPRTGFFFFFNQNGAPENLENLYRLSYVQISQFPNNKDSMARGTLLEVALLLLLSTLDGSILHI